MLDKPYDYSYLGRRETGRNDPTHIARYRFKGKVRKYLVVFDTLSCGFVEFKFHALDDHKARNPYNKIFNDGDSIKVVSTCINILFDYWKRYPDSSFWLYAVPRKSKPNLYKGNRTDDQYKVVRYSIFKYFFENIFSPDDFHHLHDSDTMIYVILNTRTPNPVGAVASFSRYLFLNYSIIFSPAA